MSSKKGQWLEEYVTTSMSLSFNNISFITALFIIHINAIPLQTQHLAAKKYSNPKPRVTIFEEFVVKDVGSSTIAICDLSVQTNLKKIDWAGVTCHLVSGQFSCHNCLVEKDHQV